ncbi:Ras-related protein Rab-37 [Striga asiatica]|uniref:Ras-related protein Rab-37 n=1 Tax=Striga asiatica TaxID=4170 RepID=A0A5A7REB6_STRAF|nr:Ras-related protein Rab-37 [Striga asiatica]
MADLKFHQPAGKMTHLSRKIVRVKTRWMLAERIAVFRRFLRSIWDRILVCSPNNNINYRKLKITFPESVREIEPNTEPSSSGYESDSDLVSLKISLLGDCHIGKTTFLLKYVGDENEKRRLQMKGLNVMDKRMGVEGEGRSFDQVPIACKNAVAIFFMFDLTSRCTLNSIIGWYKEARKWNQTAIPVVIGTKFDDFVQLPLDIQWSVITQARTYAKAMKATLFFSSAMHNINVNKIFKYIIAKLFNLPWTVDRNLTIGEPIIDY